MALCARVLLAVSLASVLLGLGLALWQQQASALLLPLAVMAGGATQWLTMWATRAQRFQLLAFGRVLLYGGGSLIQLALGLLDFGVWACFWAQSWRGS